MKQENRKVISGLIVLFLGLFVVVGFVARWVWFSLRVGYVAGNMFLNWIDKDDEEPTP